MFHLIMGCESIIIAVLGLNNGHPLVAAIMCILGFIYFFQFFGSK